MDAQEVVDASEDELGIQEQADLDITKICKEMK